MFEWFQMGDAVLKFLGPITLAILASTSGVTLAQGTASVQSALTLLGYDPGPVDGAWGNQTRTALEEYYAAFGREFSGQLGVRDYGTLLSSLEAEIASRFPSENARPLDLAAHFQTAKDVWFPAQYAFADGADTPAREEQNFAVLHPYVHDLDGDGCDDILVQFMDSNAHPYIIRGRPGDAEASAFLAELATDIPKSRSIRNAAIRDIDGDGKPDFVGFTAPHGLEGMGYVPSPEHEIVIPQGGDAWATPHDTYAHGGLVGDVNGDGVPDIFAISEGPGNARYAVLGDGYGGFSERVRLNVLPSEVIFDAYSADLNGDDVDDFVFITALDYVRQKQVPPARASEHGTLAIALGEPGKSLDQLQFTRLGTHVMDEWHWAAYGLQNALGFDADSGYSGGGVWTYSAPSNVELIDFDDDGDLDILVGYFVSSNSSWHTSGFGLFRNDDGQFTDVTAEVAPHQPANLHAGMKRTDAMIGAAMVDLDRDGAKDLLLSVQTPDHMHHSRFRASAYLNVDGSFMPVAASADPTRDLAMLTTGDFNCDGIADLAGNGRHNRSEYSMRILLGAPLESAD